MDHPGFEPGTNRLKAEYSTVELVIHSDLFKKTVMPNPFGVDKCVKTFFSICKHNCITESSTSHLYFMAELCWPTYKLKVSGHGLPYGPPTI